MTFSTTSKNITTGCAATAHSATKHLWTSRTNLTKTNPCASPLQGDHQDGLAPKHQKDKNAKKLWEYYQAVIDWAAATFTTKRIKIMRGVPWGVLYNQFKDKTFDTNKIEAETVKLIDDDEVTNQKGIYRYILTRDERFLSLRTFDSKQKQKAYEKQKGICPKCAKKKRWELAEMEADHITPWHSGGKTVLENCQMLCMPCNRTKSGK